MGREHSGSVLFVWFDSLRPINNLSVIKGRDFLGWTSTKLGLMFLLKDTTQLRQWGSNPRPFGLESSTLPLSHCAPYSGSVVECLTQDQGAAGSSLTNVTVWCPWARHINPSLGLVQPRKTLYNWKIVDEM